MEKTGLKAIIAVNNLGYIGKDNTLIWRSADDLVHFKKLTLGQKLLVGYNTNLCLPPLKNREIIVDQRYIYYKDADWCIGGKKTYEKYAPLFTELHISHINDNTIGDTMMPDFRSLNPECKIFNYYFATLTSAKQTYTSMPADYTPTKPVSVKYTSCGDSEAGFQGDSVSDGYSGFRG